MKYQGFYLTYQSYHLGIVGLLWFFVWCLAIHPKPEVHPTISDAERNYIMDSLGQKKNEKVIKSVY